jgi:hypothetical protein
MNLASLQTNLCDLIKSRVPANGLTDDYLKKVSESNQLRLIQKIAFWWRMIQVEEYCRLSTTLLKKTGEFDRQLQNFITAKDFSYFRDEVGLQFLEYLVANNPDSLTRSVAAFELSLLHLKLGEPVETYIDWKFEPYAVIDGLLKDTFDTASLFPGNYQVIVSSARRKEMFWVVNKEPGVGESR